MIPPAMPANENERVESLKKLHVLNTPAEERFDRVTRLGKRLFGVPICLISLIDSNRQWFKSAQGVVAAEMPREISFCGHAILGEDIFVVENAERDTRFQDNPLVKGEPFIRFYAGQPIRGADGNNLGTFCIIDRNPRQLSSEDRESLKDLALMAEKELQVVHLSQIQSKLISQLEESQLQTLTDPLTQAWNRQGMTKILAKELEQAEKMGLSMGLCLADIDHFKKVNDTYGHLAGDEVLREMAQRIRMLLGPYNALARYGGEEFFLLFSGCDRDKAYGVAEKIRQGIAAAPVDTAKEKIPITMSFGVVAGCFKNAELTQQLQKADEALYAAKRSGRNKVALAV